MPEILKLNNPVFIRLPRYRLFTRFFTINCLYCGRNLASHAYDAQPINESAICTYCDVDFAIRPKELNAHVAKRHQK